MTADYIYDGDGNRVKATVNGVTTSYIGSYFEWSNGTATKYYSAGSSRVAVRVGTALSYLVGDHLGSTSLATDANGVVTGELRYTAWGETRYSNGAMPTQRKYTGQLQAEAGLYFYNARFYDPQLGRFAQADSIVPGAGNPAAWDRFAYTLNNPVNGTDPTGHLACFDEHANDPECKKNNPATKSAVSKLQGKLWIVKSFESYLNTGLTDQLGYTPVPINYSPVFPRVNNRSIGPDDVANGLNVVSRMMDINSTLEAFGKPHLHIPGAVGFFMDATAQNYRDENLNLTQGQHFWRGIIAGIKGQFESIVDIAGGVLTGSTMSAIYPPAAPAAFPIGFFSGYTLTNNMFESKFETAQLWLFKTFNLEP